MYNVPCICNSMVRPSRWLFSCSLYVSCPTNACFTSLSYAQWLSSMLVPGRSWWLFSNKLVVRGLPHSPGFPSNQWANQISVPHNWQFPACERKLATMFCHHLLHTVRSCCGTLLQTCRSPSITTGVSVSDSFFLKGQMQANSNYISTLCTSHPTLNTCSSRA